ncbi:MAG: hypothetical protein ABI627_02875 [Polyangiaceae bacterium]
MLLLSCGKAIKDADGPSGGSGGMGAGGDAGASGNTSGDSGAAGSPTCPLGLASAEEIAATPRADINLELLALQLSPGHFIADPSIYDRVVRDVTAIRVADPAIADIGFFASTDGRGIYLDIDDDTFAEMQQGTYHAWDCLNETYGKTGLNLGTPNPQFPNSGTITLKGIYDIPQLVPLYAELKGIKSAGQNYDGIGDGPTICVTPSPTVWHYVFDRAGGDCPAGCTTHEYHHFSTSLAGDIESLGDLQPSEVDTYASLKACRGR